MQKAEDKSLKDSGCRTEFKTGAQRELAPGKGRYDLLPGIAIARIMRMTTAGKCLNPIAIRSLAKVYEAGAKKYADRNWEKGLPLWSFIDSGLRHLYKCVEGLTDENHPGQALWNLVCYIDTALAIQNGSASPELLQPRPRLQEWPDEGTLIESDAKPSFENAIALVHAHTGTDRFCYVFDAIVMLCEVIGNGELKSKSTRDLVRFGIGAKVTCKGEIGIWTVVGIDDALYRIRRGNRYHNAHKLDLERWQPNRFKDRIKVGDAVDVVSGPCFSKHGRHFAPVRVYCVLGDRCRCRYKVNKKYVHFTAATEDLRHAKASDSV